MTGILNFLFPPKLTQTNNQPDVCFGISNADCVANNKAIAKARTIYKTITVGLELPNAQGQLVRFTPREVTFIVKQG